MDFIDIWFLGRSAYVGYSTANNIFLGVLSAFFLVFFGKRFMVEKKWMNIAAAGLVILLLFILPFTSAVPGKLIDTTYSRTWYEIFPAYMIAAIAAAYIKDHVENEPDRKKLRYYAVVIGMLLLIPLGLTLRAGMGTSNLSTHKKLDGIHEETWLVASRLHEMYGVGEVQAVLPSSLSEEMEMAPTGVICPYIDWGHTDENTVELVVAARNNGIKVVVQETARCSESGFNGNGFTKVGEAERYSIYYHPGEW